MTMMRRHDRGRISQVIMTSYVGVQLESGGWITVTLVVAITSAQSLVGQQPSPHVPAEDTRNTNITTVTTHMPLPEFTSLKAWEQRKAFLRNQILVSAGL